MPLIGPHILDAIHVSVQPVYFTHDNKLDTWELTLPKRSNIPNCTNSCDGAGAYGLGVLRPNLGASAGGQYEYSLALPALLSRAFDLWVAKQ